MSYWTDRLEGLGQGKLVESIRALLPSQAKEKLRTALHENEMAYQKALLSNSMSTFPFVEMRDVLTGVLKELGG